VHAICPILRRPADSIAVARASPTRVLCAQ
jgi:hypothetical protein